MSIKIIPTRLSGTVHIPPSKSMAHRLLICAGLASGKSEIYNLSMSQDIKATIGAFKQLGKSMDVIGDKCIIDGNFSFNNPTIDCFESGSTLRFLIPIVSVLGGATLTGKEDLGKRPISVYEELFAKQGLSIKQGFPMNVAGGLKSKEFIVRGDISSQFISGLMLAAPLMNEDVTITISTKLESKAYVDMTILAMEYFGVKVESVVPYSQYMIKQGQSYKSRNISCEGDWSQCAFWMLAGLNSPNQIEIDGLDMNSTQGDKVIIDIAKKMNANIIIDKNRIIIKESKLTPCDIDISQCPDLAPAVAAMMSLTDETCKLTGCARLRVKESDRIESIIDTINSCGGYAKCAQDTIIIERKPIGGNVDSHNDHRIAMMAAGLSCHAQKEITINDETVVNKSYPDFWQHFEKLGGKYVKL